MAESPPLFRVRVWVFLLVFIVMTVLIRVLYHPQGVVKLILECGLAIVLLGYMWEDGWIRHWTHVGAILIMCLGTFRAFDLLDQPWFLPVGIRIPSDTTTSTSTVNTGHRCSDSVGIGPRWRLRANPDNERQLLVEYETINHTWMVTQRFEAPLKN